MKLAWWATGIGAGIATRLAAEGAKVVVNYSRKAADADAVVQRVVAAGGTAVAIRANIAKPDEIAGLVSAAIDHFGRLDILVNNAGVYKVDTLDTLDATSFAEHFDLNVRGLLLATQAAARVMASGGVIVNISSPLGRVGQPADIAAAVAWAVSADGNWVTGTTIDVAGGMVF